MNIYTSRPIYTEDRAVQIVEYAIWRATVRESACRGHFCRISLDEDSVIRVHVGAARLPARAGVVKFYFGWHGADPRTVLDALVVKCVAACRAAR